MTQDAPQNPEVRGYEVRRLRAGPTWASLIGEDLREADIVRLIQFLGAIGGDDLVWVNYEGKGIPLSSSPDVVERWVLVGEDNSGRQVFRRRLSASVDELLDKASSIYLCTHRGTDTDSSIPVNYILIDSGERDSYRLVTRTDDLHALHELLGMGRSGGTVWRGSVTIDSEPYEEFDEEPIVFPDLLLENLVRDTVGFLEGPVAERLREWNLPEKRGVLLHGPPGTGKTVLTKICAKRALAAGLNVVVIEGTRRSRLSRSSMGIGDELRDGIDHGRCLVVFEDIDLHCASRDEHGRELAEVNRGLIDLLDFLDGQEPNDGYVLLATTNYRECLDPALMRPGRFDIVQRVLPPATQTAVEALQRMLLIGPVPVPDARVAVDLLPGVTFADLAEVARRFKVLAAESHDRTLERHNLLLSEAAEWLVQERSSLRDGDETD